MRPASAFYFFSSSVIPNPVALARGKRALRVGLGFASLFWRVEKSQIAKLVHLLR